MLDIRVFGGWAKELKFIKLWLHCCLGGLLGLGGLCRGFRFETEGNWEAEWLIWLAYVLIHQVKHSFDWSLFENQNRVAGELHFWNCPPDYLRFNIFAKSLKSRHHSQLRQVFTFVAQRWVLIECYVHIRQTMPLLQVELQLKLTTSINTSIDDQGSFWVIAGSYLCLPSFLKVIRVLNLIVVIFRT